MQLPDIRINMGHAGSSLQRYLVLVWSNRERAEIAREEMHCSGKTCETTV